MEYKFWISSQPELNLFLKKISAYIIGKYVVNRHDVFFMLSNYIWTALPIIVFVIEVIVIHTIKSFIGNYVLKAGRFQELDNICQRTMRKTTEDGDNDGEIFQLIRNRVRMING